MRDKWTKFVNAYIQTDNATKAAKAAGYTEKSAYSQGSRLTKQPDIIDAIAKAREKAAIRSEVTLDSLIAECELAQKLALEGNVVMDRYGNPSKDESGQFKTKLELPSYIKAVELKAKLTGKLIERRDTVVKSIDNMSEAELKAELVRGAEQKAKLTVVR